MGTTRASPRMVGVTDLVAPCASCAGTEVGERTKVLERWTPEGPPLRIGSVDDPDEAFRAGGTAGFFGDSLRVTRRGGETDELDVNRIVRHEIVRP